jgi:hypothetical protein
MAQRNTIASSKVGSRNARGSRGVGFPTPDQIRLSIQQLVAEESIDKAESLAQEGLVVYPENEGVLAISGLVAIVRNDWARAVDLLDRLMMIQGERASDFTKMMYERARHCLAESQGNSLHAERQVIAAKATSDQ